MTNIHIKSINNQQNPQSQLQFVEHIHTNLLNLVQVLNTQKTKLIQKCQQQKKYLINNIYQKQYMIQKMQMRIHQLQKQNQQIKFQYQQRISLMNILKKQNWIISKQFSQQKTKINMTIDYLVAENQKLQQKIIMLENSVHKQMLMQTPKRIFNKNNTDKNHNILYTNSYTMNQLYTSRSQFYQQNQRKSKKVDQQWTELSIDKRMNDKQDIYRGNTSNSCINATKVGRRPSYFNQSRATEIRTNYKSLNKNIYETQTKTMLLRYVKD